LDQIGEHSDTEFDDYQRTRARETMNFLTLQAPGKEHEHHHRHVLDRTNAINDSRKKNPEKMYTRSSYSRSQCSDRQRGGSERGSTKQSRQSTAWRLGRHNCQIPPMPPPASPGKSEVERSRPWEQRTPPTQRARPPTTPETPLRPPDKTRPSPAAPTTKGRQPTTRTPVMHAAPLKYKPGT